MVGRISLAELLKDEEKMKIKVANCFKTLDKDGSGYLEGPELTRFVRAMNQYLAEELEVPEAKVDDFIKQYDTNGDGKIDEVELFEFYKGFWADKLN